jgi:hypothetical protein
LKKYGFIFLLLASSTLVSAYTRITASNGDTPKWTSMPVSYWINESGSSQILNDSEFAAVRASFQVWEQVPTADVRFVYKGTTSVSGVARDGMNIVSFNDTTTPLGSSTIAATFTFYRSEILSDGVIHPVVDEADILFNPNLEFSTSAESGKFDIQSVLTHEVGHLLGLDHSALISSVMVPFGSPSQLDQRTLQYDDIAGITEIYPKPSATAGLGQIQGTIRSGAAPVFGANVVAVNSDGTTLLSTLSQPSGSYTLRFLPPGTYRVFAEPLDQPVAKEHIGGGTTGFFSTIRTDFGTTYFGNVPSLGEARTINVTAGGTASADISTLPKGATGLNLTRPAFGFRLARGKTYSITVGGEDISAGVAFTTSNPSLIPGSPTFGGRISSVASTSAQMNLSVPAATPIGPKSLAVNRGTDVSISSGALVITDPPPADIAVSPATGPVDGGTPVTISGSNFRPGAQVYFSGLAASSVTVATPGAISATAPANSPGAVNVVVVNADGTWGSASRAYTYDTGPPVIRQVTPLSGPPATIVTIEGENFDASIANVAVQFGGVSARIVTATPKTITAIVPYGAPTAPITVSVFGRVATGPTFIVTAPAVSTNLAAATFKFIDASAASGGAAVNFTNNDDAVSQAALPFDFSLFRDIYLAGSPVYITTNGFLSLEFVSPNTTFQNGALPGQTVTQPLGGTGVIPPSLVAPFWDDLVMKSNSTVTTRTLGNAPNRQFVVQWSNMSILDEDGRDQNAGLTFEAVLFEGSNDIQFMYSTMSGPRSDGSSATIGLQDLKRVAAVQSGFNQPIISSGFFKVYHFDNGEYGELAADLSPPTTPLVTDEGNLTANKAQLVASWTAEDPESGIREFQYAIGTTPGGTDVKPFVSTTQNSVVVTGLNLQSGTTYYFAVRAVNSLGLASDIGVSDGIRYDSSYQPQTKIIPSGPVNSSEFTGLAFLAPVAMNVVLRAYDANGALIAGSNVHNPATISLAAGQQYARLLTELLGVQNFDGWIEAEASAPGLGIFTATGAWNMSTLDGSVARDTSTDFVLFHAGASAILVNPSSRVANVVMGSQSFSIPPRGRFVTTLQGTVRVQSSEALAAVERVSAPGKLSINGAVPVSDARSNLVFADAVIGGGYTSTLLLANVSGMVQTAAVAFGATTGTVTIGANSSIRVSLASLLQLAPGDATVGAVRITPSSLFGQQAVVGVLDIENQTGLVTVGARPAAMEFTFPHVVNGSGLFTGLAFATGSAAAKITIEVYDSSGSAPKSASVTLNANQQLGRLLDELVQSAGPQIGGYIRVRSDQPIWAWEIYGSGNAMASGPPL